MSKTYVVEGTRESLRKLLEKAGFEVEELDQGDLPVLDVKRAEGQFSYQALFDSAFDMIFAHEISADGEYGTFTEVNELACQLTGYSREELQGMRPQDLLDPQIVDLETHNSTLLTEQRQGSFDRVLVTRDGKRFPVEIHTRVLKLNDRDFALSIVRDVSERQEAQNQLRESERNYRALFESMDTGFALNEAVFDSEGRLTDLVYRDVNPAYEAILGFRREEIIGRGAAEAFGSSPERIKAFEKLYEEVVSLGAPVRVELPREGRDQWMSVQAYSPRPGQFATLVNDITAQKQVETQLLEYGERLKMALEASREGLWDWDVSSGDVYFSPAWKSILDDQEFPPRYEDWIERLHPGDRERVVGAMRRHLEGGTERWKEEHRLRARDGSWKWVLSRGEVVSRDESGRAQRMLGTMSDISERKEAEFLLREEREKAETYLKLVGVVMVAIDRDGVVTLINDKGCELLGCSREEILGRDWFGNFLPDEIVERVRSVFDKLMNGEEELAEFLENPIQNCYGQTRIIAWQNTILRDREGGIIGTLSAGEDVTDRRLAEENLARSEARYRYAFESAPVSIWEQDYSEAKTELERLWSLGVEDWEAYLDEHPELVFRFTTMFRTTDVNDETVKLFEAESRDQLLGSIEKVFTSETLAGMRDEMLTFLRGERSYQAESSFLTLKGRTLQIAFRIDLPADLESDQVLVTLNDVTERKLAEDRLRESEEKYRRLTETAPAIITRIRLGERPYWEFASAHTEELTGYSPEELYARPELLVAILHPDDRHHFEDALRGILKEPVFRMRLICRDGEVRWVDTRARLILDAEGRPEAVEAYLTDITEKKAVEEELDRAFREISLLKERVEAENISLRAELRMSHLHGEMVGESEALKRVLMQAEQVAETDSTVLILGQTGTGKELLARAIHRMSARAEKPLIMVNCAAIPDQLIENELFGSEKGAFTGSHTRQIGRFEAAHGGTLVLDEIGELPLDLQAKLLRVLQDGRFERLGSTKSIQVDVRLIASTNADLERKIAEGGFRQDLFYRLNVFPVTVPPLAERPGDIRLLTRAFVEEFAIKMGKPIEQISERSMRELEQYSWPGNVRELRNIVERAMIECRSSTLNIRVRPSAVAEGSAEASRRMADVEKRHISEVLRDARWKVRGEGGAAEILGLNPSTLESRMRKLGIKRPS